MLLAAAGNPQVSSCSDIIFSIVFKEEDRREDRVIPRVSLTAISLRMYVK
jgi:hypothetical protein